MVAESERHVNRAGRMVVAWALVLLAIPTVDLHSQGLDVGDRAESYLRLLQLTGRADPGSFTVRPLGYDRARQADSVPGHPWAGRLRLEPGHSNGPVSWSVGESRLRMFVNPRYPWGQNDGAVWQGKGLTTAFETKGTLEWKGLSITLNPMVLYNQNSEFELATVDIGNQPEYAYPWRIIDYPQRFGPDEFWTFDLGQSQVALDWRGARISLGNESLWWGPGIQNAIIMGANAPGFVHASLGTDGPIKTAIGDFEANWIWGGLDQSDWFDPTVENRDRFLTGLVVAYSPAFLSGLSVGFTRVFQELVTEDGIPAGEYLLVWQGLLKVGQTSGDNPEGRDLRDQLLSIFARWVLPESGFEAYLEWARNDHSWDLQDFLLEPEHSQAYTLGFQKVTSFSEARIFVLRGELTHLEASPTFQVRSRGTYYEHGRVTQGYTHKGQILGAGIGPGGNAQSLGFDWYEGWGSAGLFLQRQVHDNDAYWLWAEANDATFTKHDVSFDIQGHARVFLDAFEFAGGVTFTRELNRYFYGPKRNNVNMSLTARWRPGTD